MLTVSNTQVLQEEKAEKQEMTFKEFFDTKYMEDYAKHKIKRWKNVVADIDRQAKHLYDRKMSTIQRDDIQKIFNELTKSNKKVMANRCVERFIGIFERAVEWGILEKNPIIGIVKHKEKSRDRYLLPEEMERFFTSLAKEPNKTATDFFLMCLYSGARADNVLTMHWDNINLNNKTWYIPDTKSGKPHLLPLIDKALETLKVRYEKRNDNNWVFPSVHNSQSGHI